MNDGILVQSGEGNWLNIVQQQVKSLRFGVVQIVVHESKVVQIEKTEKVRLGDSAGQRFPQPTLPNQTTGGSNNLK